MKEKKKQIDTIIYGGAFNPPTRAHNAILQACVDHAETIEADVWLLPSGNRSDKTIEKAREDRLRMIEAMRRDVVKRTVQIDIETCELDRTVEVETIDTVDELHEAHPDRNFIWVFGADSVATMESWKDGERLKRELAMLVIARPGFELDDIPGNMTQITLEPMDVSSTLVRARLAAHEPIDDLVTPTVLAWLR
jgi:nicotinate-nucleotide adenylyltransferase